MGIGVKLPISINVDNFGAIFLSNNHSLGHRTKPIDMRRHFVREFVEYGIIKTNFVGTANNETDIHTKNTSEETFNKHVSKHLMDVRTIN
jgi:hypothetical protein